MEYTLMSSLEQGINQAFVFKNVIMSISKSLDAYINRENTVNNKDIKRINVAQASTISNNYHESCLSIVIKEYGNAEAKCTQQKINLINHLQANIQKPFVDFLKEFPALSKKYQKLKNICSSVRNLNLKLNALGNNENQLDHKLIKNINVKSEVSEVQIRSELEATQTEFISSAKHLKKLIFDTIVKEKQLISKLTSILEHHIEYHKSCTELQMNYVAEIKTKIGQDKFVYGVDLVTHLKNENCEISHVINDCVNYLMGYLDTKGLFRINAQESKVKKLMSIFNSGLPISDSYLTDEHTVASSLKRYLIQLPSPLIPFSFYNETKEIVKIKSKDSTIKLKKLIAKLPKQHYVNIRYVMKFLTEVVKFSKENMMDVGNIGIVFGPCVLRQDSDAGPDLSFCDKEVVSLMVNNFDEMFPEGCVLNTQSYFRFTCGLKSKSKSSVRDSPRDSNNSGSKGTLLTSGKDYSHTPPYHFTNPAAYSPMEKRK